MYLQSCYINYLSFLILCIYYYRFELSSHVIYLLHHYFVSIFAFYAVFVQYITSIHSKSSNTIIYIHSFMQLLFQIIKGKKNNYSVILSFLIIYIITLTNTLILLMWIQITVWCCLFLVWRTALSIVKQIWQQWTRLLFIYLGVCILIFIFET